MAENGEINGTGKTARKPIKQTMEIVGAYNRAKQNVTAPANGRVFGRHVGAKTTK
jgi:hypothetical protein